MTRSRPLGDPDADGPGISLETLCYIIVKARTFAVQTEIVEPDYGQDAVDDQARQVLEAYADDPTHQELAEAINGLNLEEQYRLVALVWLGRGTYSRSEWADAVKAATDGHTPHTALYLTGLPLLADYLENGLAAFGLSYADIESRHL